MVMAPTNAKQKASKKKKKKKIANQLQLASKSRLRYYATFNF